jgi:hypothetical protein
MRQKAFLIEIACFPLDRTECLTFREEIAYYVCIRFTCFSLLKNPPNKQRSYFCIPGVLRLALAANHSALRGVPAYVWRLSASRSSKPRRQSLLLTCCLPSMYFHLSAQAQSMQFYAPFLERLGNLLSSTLLPISAARAARTSLRYCIISAAVKLFTSLSQQR